MFHSVNYNARAARSLRKTLCTRPSRFYVTQTLTQTLRTGLRDSSSIFFVIFFNRGLKCDTDTDTKSDTDTTTDTNSKHWFTRFFLPRNGVWSVTLTQTLTLTLTQTLNLTQTLTLTQILSTGLQDSCFCEMGLGV